jgi:AcrR family transcriptional regulator
MGRVSTRDRLCGEALRLFATNGFTETTVGDIEEAAGLQPRRGALYRHFGSKEELLMAAVETHVASVEAALARIDAVPPADLAADARAWGRWFLAELDAERNLFRVLEQDGDRFPGLRDVVRERVVDAGHRRIGELIRQRHPAAGAIDAEALALLVIGPLVHHRRAMWTFGRPPVGVDDERLLQAWSDALPAHLDPASRRSR